MANSVRQSRETSRAPDPVSLAATGGTGASSMAGPVTVGGSSIHLNVHRSGSYAFDICTIDGKRLLSVHAGALVAGKQSIDIGELANGINLLRISGKEMMQCFRFVKQ